MNLDRLKHLNEYLVTPLGSQAINGAAAIQCLVVFRRTLKGLTVLDEQAVLTEARRMRNGLMAGEGSFAI